MAREIPWTTLEELIALLKSERDLLDQQIAALEASRNVDEPTARLAFLLARYSVEGSAARAVLSAKELGWRIVTTNRGKPSSRDWQPEDLHAAIRNPPEGLPPGLVKICQRVFRSADKAVRRSYG